ncbi:MAG: hypothetical protein IKY70_06710, partial [Bacteroidales bacterium]|nr:hypothetical protein [Bacteroidales bacterium]
MNKIFLIDGHAQIFRMYYAFMRRPMVNSKGMDTSILFGFTKMLLELIAKEQPTHLAVAFDPPAKTFRHEAYEEYKANRSAAPELVKQALEPLQEILAAFGIPVVMMPGYEADDVIGSMATQWGNETNKVFMVTPDKDYGQLITEDIFQYKPAKGGNDVEVLGKEQICAHYGVCDPQQVIDILTIWGDASDNVPGVRGIGEVGARKLVGKYGGIESIQAHLEELPPKQREAFLEAASQLEMSRFLITIKTDINLPLTLQNIELKEFNYKDVLSIFNKYEFNSLRKLLPVSLEELKELENSSENIPFGNEQTPEDKADTYVFEEAPLSEVISAAQRDRIAGLHITDGGTIILSGYKNEKASLEKRISIAEVGNLGELESREALYKDVKMVLEDKTILKVGYGFKECIKELWRIGIDLNGSSSGYLENVGDVSIMHYLINPERSHKPDMLIKSYLNVDPESWMSDGGDANKSCDVELDLFSAPVEENLPGAGIKDKRECALMLPLYGKILEALECAGQSRLYFDIEMPLIGVLSYMEWQGVKIDTGHLKEYSLELTSELNEIEQQARELAGDESINLSSP